MTRAIMWFRRDLRLTDNSAVLAALAEHSDVIPVFVVDPHLMKNAGAPRVAYMCDALAALNASMGGALVFRHGDPVDVIVDLAKELDASDVYIARDFAPYGRRRDIEIAERLVSQGRRLRGVGSPYAVAPGRVMKDDGTSYSVFTPFSKRWLALGWDGPQDAPRDPQWLGVPVVRSDGAPLRPEIDFVLPPHDEESVHDQWNEFRLRGAEGLDGYVERR
nr:deoxyribodipyrimidine photo-lyase [Actinomycetota bacterium]